MSAEESKESVQERAEKMMARLSDILENAQTNGLTESFSKPIQVTKDLLTTRPNDATIKTKIVVFQSGTFLDQLFLDQGDKSLGGIPKVAQIGITGNPDVGKSLIADEIALRLASEGHKVILTTSEDIFEADNDDLICRVE